MKYVVSYDLREPGRDYESLYAALNALDAKRLMQSEWCLRHNNTTAVELRDHFWQYMDNNDRLLVASLDNNNWAGRNLMFNPNDI